VILVGVLPCAGLAAVWTALLRGDVPLGMAINGLTMILAPFLIPPLMVWLAGSNINIDVLAMFRQLAIILLIPLVVGVAARWLVDRYLDIKPFLPVLPALSALTAVLLIMFTACTLKVTAHYLAGLEYKRIYDYNQRTLGIQRPKGFVDVRPRITGIRYRPAGTMVAGTKRSR